MQTITKYIIILVLSFYTTNAIAQDTETSLTQEEQIALLKEKINDQEKEALKTEVEHINDRVIKKEITYEEGEELKQDAAKKRALNIEDRISIMENRIAFYDRNNIPNGLDQTKAKTFSISFGGNEANLLGATILSNKKEVETKYDFRTLSGLVAAAGINNAIIDGQSLSDSPYKIGGSGFVELGFQFKTRILKNSNLARLRYGLSFQWNKYDLKDNKYFVQNDNITTLETFPTDLKKSKFVTTNIVLPIYFEFGQHDKIEKKDRIRFITKGFKFGFGGYVGLNLGAKQKLIYEENGDRVKQKIKTNYNVNPFIYGVGAYVGYNDVSLFMKYDLSETFKNDNLKQNNISLGIRLELE